jgi:hypothetical protein
LSILTTSAERVVTAGSSIGRPVNGMTGAAGTVVDVEVDAPVELVDDEDEDEVVLASVVGAGSVVGVVGDGRAVVFE